MTWFIGCKQTPSEKITEKITEKVTEKVNEKATEKVTEKVNRSVKIGISTPPLELLLGKVTSIAQIKGHLALGHENGVISLWLTPRSIDPDSLISSHRWVAHEGAVRLLEINHSQEILSLGAGGSWARWSLDSRRLERFRASDVYTNHITSDQQGGWLVAGARGVVARWQAGKRLWKSAGEHGRATFAVARFDSTRVLSVGSDGWLRCWNIKGGDACGSIPLHQGWMIALQAVHSKYSKSQSQMISQDSISWWLTAGSDGMIKVWSTTQLEEALHKSKSHPSAAPLQGRHQDLPLKPNDMVQAHHKNITKMIYQNGLVLSGSEDGSISLFEFSTEGKLTLRWHYQSESIKPVLSLALDFDKQQVLIGGGRSETILWSMPFSTHTSLKLTPLMSVRGVFQ